MKQQILNPSRQPDYLSNRVDVLPISTVPLWKMLDDKTGIMPAAWETTVGKILLISGGVIVLLFASGGFFRVLAWTMEGWNRLRKEL